MALFIKRSKSLYHNNEIHVVALSIPKATISDLEGARRSGYVVAFYRGECMYLLFVSVRVLYCFLRLSFLFLVLPRYILICER
jgi:hypothetical protein